MIEKRLFIIGLVVCLAIGVAACTRSISSSPTSLEPTQAGAGTVMATNELMNQIVLAATQTAQAKSGIAAQATVTQTLQVQKTQTSKNPTAPAGQATATQAPQQPAPTQTPLATIVPVPSATPGIPSNITLHAGESAYCIARRYNVNPTELLQINGLGTNTILSPGMVLKIPQTGNPFPAVRARNPHPTTYTVNAGDTIYTVACWFGDLDPNAIVIANGLKSPYTLTAGQVLQIP